MLETLLAIRPSGAQHELVILKRIGSRHREDHALIGRLLGEARAALPLRHRNVVEIFDVVPGSMSIVTEYLPGDSLHVLLARGIPVPAVCTIAHDVAAALAFAHQHRGLSFTHRALSPASVLVADSGVAKVDDFGVMRVVVSHPAAGDLAPQVLRYAAPESRREQNAGAPADLYALGAILHEALTGLRFGSGAAPRTTQHALPRVAPPSATNPHVPWQLDRLVTQLLEPDPRRRPSAAETMARLDELPRASAEQLGQWLTAAPRRKARRRALEEKAIEQVRAQGFAGWTPEQAAMATPTATATPRAKARATPDAAKARPNPASGAGPGPRPTQGTPPTRQVAVRPPRHLRTATPAKGGHARGGDAWWLSEPAQQRAPGDADEPDTRREPALQPVPAHTPAPRWQAPPTETGQVLRTPAAPVQALPVRQPRSRARAPRDRAEPSMPSPSSTRPGRPAPPPVAAAPSAPVVSPESGILVAPPTLALALARARVGPRRWLCALTAAAAIALGSAALWPVLTDHAVRAGGADLETLHQSMTRTATAASPAARPTFEPISPAASPAAEQAPSLVVSPGRDATIAPEHREPLRASQRRVKRADKRIEKRADKRVEKKPDKTSDRRKKPRPRVPPPAAPRGGIVDI